MSQENPKFNDSSLILIYKEILSLRSVIDGLQERLTAMENNLCETQRDRRRKNSTSTSLSPLQQKILGFLKEGNKTQNEMAQILDMRQPSVSHSLSKLEKELDIVESRPTTKPGARFEYALKKNLSKEVLELLSEL